MFAHFAGNMGRNYVAVFQLYAECGVGQGFYNRAFHLDMFFFCHVLRKSRFSSGRAIIGESAP